MAKKFKQGKRESLKGYYGRVYRAGYKTPSAMRKVATGRYEKVSAWFAKEHPAKVKRVAAGYYGAIDKEVAKIMKDKLGYTLQEAKIEGKRRIYTSPKYAKKRVTKKRKSWKRRGGMIDARKDLSTIQLKSGLWYRLTITADYENDSSGEKLEGVTTSSRWHKQKEPYVQQDEAERAARAMFGESGWHLIPETVHKEWETRNIG